MPLYRNRDRSRGGRSDYTTSSSAYGSSEADLSASVIVPPSSRRNPLLDSSIYSSSCYSSFGPVCGDWRLNATVSGDNVAESIDRILRASCNNRRGSLEESAGYGLDTAPTATPHVKTRRGSRVRQLLKELILGGGSASRSRRREKSRGAENMPPAGTRACSLTLPPGATSRHKSNSPRIRRRDTSYYMNSQQSATPLRQQSQTAYRIPASATAVFFQPRSVLDGRQHFLLPNTLQHYDIDCVTPRTRRGSIEDHQRRLRKQSMEGWSMQMRTPSADTVLEETKKKSKKKEKEKGKSYGGGAYEPAVYDTPKQQLIYTNPGYQEAIYGLPTPLHIHSSSTPDSSVVGGEEPQKKRKKKQGGGPPAPIRVRAYETPKAQHVEIRERMPTERYRQEKKNAFVNSHEWTLSRSVSELHLGVIGYSQSGKTAVIHRYLTGTYQSDESPEGGRFKKEVVLDGQSHLLLIRDEGAQIPEAQFTHWADAVIFVFAVDRAETFDPLPYLYDQMSKLRNITDMPLILVGSKDTVSEMSPRVVTEEQGKRMAGKLHCSAYYETHANYGTNVERVFKEACQRIFSSRTRASLGGGHRTPTPTQHEKYPTDPRVNTMYSAVPSSKNNLYYHQRSVSAMPFPDSATGQARRSHAARDAISSARGSVPDRTLSTYTSGPFPMARALSPSSSHKSIPSMSNGAFSRSSAALLDSNGLGGIDGGGMGVPGATAAGIIGMPAEASASSSHLPTPSSTPTTQRKNRRISNIFRGGKEHGEEKSSRSGGGGDVQMGVGRVIPVMQGQLYKKSGGKSALNRSEWKKKFVTLTDDGRLTYHTNIKEYMENGSGKEVFLGLAAVRLPGRQRARNSQAASMTCLEGGPRETNPARPPLTTGGQDGGGVVAGGSGEGTSDDASGGGTGTGGGSIISQSMPISSSHHPSSLSSSIPITPNTVANSSKKRRGHHIRKHVSKGTENDDDDCCFEIVTCDQKRWEFCASSAEDRETWVRAIEAQIDAALQKQLSQPSSNQRVLANKSDVQGLLDVSGNARCADCDAEKPDWASLNLGTLICMECSGIHRNLGSHISKVRSLKFDDWPLEYLAVMRAIGNDAANRIWESKASKESKPRSDASPEEREAYIRAKYVAKKFLPPLPAAASESVGTQLLSAVLDRDISSISLLLTKATPADVNSTVSWTDRRTLLHLACSNGNVEIVQLLLWNHAELRALDEQGRSALWHARHGDAADCAAVLLGAGLPADYGLPSAMSASSLASGEKDVTTRGMPSEAIMGSLCTREYVADDVTRQQLPCGGRRSTAPQVQANI